MLTRKGREALKNKVNEGNFIGLLDDLLQQEVIDFAVNIHGTHDKISQQYSSNAIIDLIPDLTMVLNRLDACLKVSADLTENIKYINNENNELRKAVENEKQNRRISFEASLNFEEEAEQEINGLKFKIAEFDRTTRKLVEDIQTKNKVIELLTIDCEDLSQRLEEKNSLLCNSCHCKQSRICDSYINKKTQEDLFIFPRKVAKQSSVTKQQSELSTSCRFTPLSLDDSLTDSGTVIQVTAQVHHQDSYCAPTPIRHAPSKLNLELKKNKIMVLSDSHGKNIYKYMDDRSHDSSVMVVSKPNAKMKQIVKEGQQWVRHFTKEDHVILMAGTNDHGRNEPHQLTIHQGLNELFHWDVEANITVVEIPFRYDDNTLNDNIFYSNITLKRKIQNYKGKLNISFVEVNSSALRSYYTRHGLHLNSKGKRYISETLIQHINKSFNISEKCTLRIQSGIGPEVDRMKNKHLPRHNEHAAIRRRTPPPHDRISEIDYWPEDPQPHAATLQPFGASSSLDDICFGSSMDDFPPLTTQRKECHSKNNSSDNEREESYFLDVLTFKENPS